MSQYRGVAIVKCKHRRETVWLLYATSNGQIASPLKELGRCPSAGSAKARVDWLISTGKI